MTRDELTTHLDTLFASDAWHWFTWHFRAGGHAGIHPFAADVIDALMAIDAKSPGFAKRMAGALSSLRGMKKHEDEVRLIFQLEHVQCEGSNYFVPYGNILLLQEVVVGLRSKITDENPMSRLSPEDQEGSIIRAHLATRS